MEEEFQRAASRRRELGDDCRKGIALPVEDIVPLLEVGETVLVAAHGNS